MFAALWKVIKRIFTAIFEWIRDFLKEFWWILLIIAIIYFAPAIIGWLTANGAPSFVITAMEGISVLTPYVTSAVQWVWGMVSSGATSAWTAFKGLELGQQAAILFGAAALLAPEETAAVVSAAVDMAAGVVETVVGAAASGLGSSGLGMLLLGGAALWFFATSGSEESDPATAGANNNSGGANA